MGKVILAIVVLGAIAVYVASCKSANTEKEQTSQNVADSIITPTHYEWSKKATIYEVNVRQFSKEGNLNAITKDLQRIKDLGIDIIWLMPIHPISVEKRKGTLGSNYAVSDYKAVNPEFGTLDEFKALVKKAHDLGMKVILDWVPNHTGFDHVWIKEHPEYYTQNEKGEIIDPINPETGESWGWTDVADLNYNSKEMRAAMIDAMKYWVVEAGVDGYRCDVAHQVPDDFWKDCIQSLRKVRSDLYFLAEGEVPSQRNECGFDADYGWAFKGYCNEIAKGERQVTELNDYLRIDRDTFKKGYHMNFTTNHDENAWEGTVFERLGDAHLTFAVLAFTFEGMPLVYSGQEAGLNKRLKFFEKDPIDWGTYKYQDFYSTLLRFKKDNPALWNGEFGAEPVYVPTKDANDKVYCYVREKEGNKVFVVLNLKGTEVKTTLPKAVHAGDYTELFSKAKASFKGDDALTLKPYEYKVYYK
jgi:glycosidase